VLKIFKTSEQRAAEAAKKTLAQQYEAEVLRPVAGGRALMEDAEADFNEKHRAVMVAIFGPKAAPDPEIDPFEIGGRP
jgi:hypothetical protein